MKIPAKIDYACKALLELSLHWPNETPVPITIIAQRQRVPLKFLTQILLTLKQLGFVESVRGKNGGYNLIMPPRNISLSQVVKGFGGLGLSVTASQSNKKYDHVMDTVWEDVDESVLKALNEVNFEIIRERSRGRENVIMFGI